MRHLMTAGGHRVFTPTLTGLGERVHLLRRDVCLDTHIADVADLLLWEDLRDIVLVGHSYGGIVVRHVADRLPDRVRSLVPGDIADVKTAERAISDGVARFGRIDTLVNNAGIFIAKPFTEYTEANYAAILGVNLTGFFHITQRAVVEMEKRQSGHIVQITTTLVDSANSQVPSVLASLTKGGLNASRLPSNMPSAASGSTRSRPA
jgi:NAD(P)-dependent dehydrogenase (short-subunit alcohol dehydrogenase family)